MVPRTALVVDDSKVARLAISKLLKERNFNVDDAASGEEALEYLERHRPDIVFMDVMMPGMGGLEATRAISSREATRLVPVVMCTGKETAADQSLAFEVGAKDILSKPAGEENLDRVLKALVAEPEAAAEQADLSVHQMVQTAAQEVDARGRTEGLATQDIVEQAVAEACTAARELAEGIAREVAESVSRQLIEKLVAESAERVAQETVAAISSDVTDKALEAAQERAEQKAHMVAEAVAMKTSQGVVAKAEETIKAMARSASAQAVAALLEQQQVQLQKTLQKAAEQNVAAVAEKQVAASFSRYVQEQGRALIQQIMEETVAEEPPQKSRSGFWRWGRRRS